MDFKAKYISEKEDKEKPDSKKIVLGNEAYAICELIDDLISKLGVMKK